MGGGTKNKKGSGGAKSLKVANKSANKASRKRFRNQTNRPSKDGQQLQKRIFDVAQPRPQKKKANKSAATVVVNAPPSPELVATAEDMAFFGDASGQAMLSMDRDLSAEKGANQRATLSKKKAAEKAQRAQDRLQLDKARSRAQGNAGGDESSSSSSSDEDREMDFETRGARSFASKKSAPTQRMPVKTLAGSLHENIRMKTQTNAGPKAALLDAQSKLPQPDKSQSESSESEASEEEEQEPQQPAETVPKVELSSAQKKRRRQQIKMQIIELCESLSADPNAHVASLSSLVELLDDSDIAVRQFATASLTNIFKDVCPSYTIKLPTPEQLKQKATMAVNRMRKFESTLLANYKRFVRYLVKSANSLRQTQKKNAANPKQQHQTAVVSVRCMCALLSRHSSFNCAKDLIHSLAPLINFHEKAVADLCYETLRMLFKTDTSGDASLEATKCIAAFVKKRAESKKTIRPEVIHVLLALPLRRGAAGAKSKQQKVRSRKKSKRSKIDEKQMDKELNRDLREADAEQDATKVGRTQTEILRHVIVTYFRMLKHHSKSNVLPAVLAGLSKFAHLINIELILDLLEFLKEIIGHPERYQLPLESALHAVHTSFRVLQGRGLAFTVDIKEFYDFAYAHMLWPFLQPENFGELPSLLKCLDLMFLKKKTVHVATNRVAAFVVRLLSLAPHLPPHGSLAVIHIVRQILSRFPQADQVLDADSAAGKFQVDVTDPELANPLATTSWELPQMHKSFHPFLTTFSSSFASNKELPVAYASLSAPQLFGNFDYSEGGFNPTIEPPAQQSKKRKRKVTGESQFLSSLSALPPSQAAPSVFRSLHSRPKEHSRHRSLSRQLRRVRAITAHI